MGKRKQHHEEHADERWLITYADMLTLMFVLFMVLFSISVVNTGKFEKLKESLSKAFSPGLFDGGPSVLEQGPEETSSPVVETPPGIVSPQIPGPLGVNLASQGASTEQGLESSQLQQAKEAIDAAVKKAGLKDQAKTTVDERGLTIRLKTDPFLFDPGSAVIHPQAMRLLRPITATILQMQNPVRVEGHTDSTPIRTAQFPSNMELGAGRSCAVLRVLWSYGLPAARTGCISFGALRPIAENDTVAHRAENRRVEILVMRLQGSPNSSAATALGG